MGLPSGLQWASCNVGAAKPSDLGLFFSWGNIVGHGIDEEYNFSQGAYDRTPAASIAADLSLDQDAARVYLGESWRMPTADELQELFDNCTSSWETMNGVDGCLFTSNINGNSVFFPAAGFFSGRSLTNRNTSGYYWSSTYVSAANAVRMLISESSVDPRSGSGRRFGFSVRAVMPSL